jgi:hypothetical protein
MNMPAAAWPTIEGQKTYDLASGASLAPSPAEIGSIAS